MAGSFRRPSWSSSWDLLAELRVEACALYAASIVVVLSLIFGYKGKRLPMKGIIEVLRATGTRVLQIYMIGCAAGIVIGVLNISGLGFGLTIS